MSIGPPIPKIQHFQNLTLKIQGQDQMTMMLHNYRSRQFHRTSNGITPSSCFRDMGSVKSGPSAAWQDKFLPIWGKLWANNYIARMHRCVRSWECNPVTPVECISLSFHTHLCTLTFITYILCTNGIEVRRLLLNEFNTRNYLFFKFTICSIALLSLGETCHLKVHDMVTTW